MSSITIPDIASVTFKAMLRYMYTDALPADTELGASSIEVF
jgi:speckle-type POZ protein